MKVKVGNNSSEKVGKMLRNCMWNENTKCARKKFYAVIELLLSN